MLVNITNIKTVYYQTVEIGFDLYELATHKFADERETHHTCRLMNSGDVPKSCSEQLTGYVVDVVSGREVDHEKLMDAPGQMELFE